MKSDERAYYANSNNDFRIPHPTHCGPLLCNRNAKVRNKTIACVSNYGGRLWFLRRHIWLRNIMILQRDVDLYGNPNSWNKFRNIFSFWKSGPPANFKGKPPGKHQYDIEYIKYLSNYKVCICLENTCEPYYFTEKFVNAVRAGCIPVYWAHPTVKEKFLKGAKWVDPQCFRFSPRKTIEYALNEEQIEYREANDSWLKSGVLDDTDDAKLMTRLHQLVKKKLKD